MSARSWDAGCPGQHNGARNLRPLAVAVALSLSCTVSLAGDNRFDGKWTLEWVFQKQFPVSAVVEINDGEGTFRDRVLVSERENNCIKLPAPARIISRGDPAYTVLEIDRSKVLAGCGRMRIRVQLEPDGSVKSEFANGNPVRWTRR